MQAYSIRACRNLADGFTESTDDLNTSAARLERGEFRTILVRPEGGNIEFSLIHHPSSHERALSLYSATFEYTSPYWSNFWNLLLGFPNLRSVSLGLEEGVQLTDISLTPESFPWNEWPLIIGAVRCDKTESRWVVKEGPEMKGRVRLDAGDAFGINRLGLES